MAHGNRGRRPSTATSPETQEQVTALAKGRYAGFNRSHLTELLAEREGVRLSRSTVRRVLLAGGVRSPRRRLLKEIIARRGVPMALYSDRHSIFQRSPQEVESRDEQLQGRREPTQFARELEELGIDAHHGPYAAGEGSRGARVGHLPGPTGLGDAPRGRGDHRGGQPDARGLPAAIRSAVRRGAGPAGTGLSPTAAGRLP